MNYYTDTILHWAAETSHVGTIANADGIGEVGLDSKEVGRRLAVRFSIKTEAQKIVDARYQVFGCGFSMATCAAVADMVMGVTLKEARLIDSSKINDFLGGLPAERIYCADLAVDALRAAVTSVSEQRPIDVAHTPSIENITRNSADHPLYTILMKSKLNAEIDIDDRHLFACLLVVASQESGNLSTALGLERDEVSVILSLYFPDIDPDFIELGLAIHQEPPLEMNDDILSLIYSYLPDASERVNRVSILFAKIVAARAATPGHLWVAMGLTERPQLSAAIRRHLPVLAEANCQNMRWKRFFFKQICDLHGGTLCKTPNCGVCSDYSICFAEEE